MKKLLIVLLYILNLEANNYQSLLFHGNCITCHFERKAVSAPSIQEIKLRYLSAFPKKENFVEYMSTWVKHPNTDTSLMSDAIEKYELMPELGYDMDTLKQISEFIYTHDFTKKDH